MISKSHLWQKTALAAAAAALFGLWGSNAAALSLGRITVLSALGEPLRAEIEVPDINTQEAASLKTVVATPEAFRAAGLEYNPAMTGLQATLQKRPDGRAYIQLSSNRAVNEPFIDMILEASWGSGRIVRDYTMLFDPPSLRQTAPTAPMSAQISPQSLSSRAQSPRPDSPVLTTPRPAVPQRNNARTPTPTAVVKVPRSRAEQVIVKSGDTASEIAVGAKPANISLDQMLVALLRANPTAFIDDNVNRVKAGSVVNIPTAEQADVTTAAEATQIIIAQSKNFNDFRRKLASNAPSTAVVAADRSATGSVQAKVEDNKSATPAPDKLTLSKGALSGVSAEDQLAKERSAKEAASRTAEIAKNISDLNKLGAASSAVAATSAATNAVAVTSPLPMASAPQATDEAAAPPPSAPLSAASTAAKRPAPVPVPQPGPGMFDDLLENPLLPAGAVGLIVLLAGFGFYRSRQRKNASQIDSSFLESRLQPDSFFGTSGGQRVDTQENPATGSSMLYTPSQLEAVDDVDPVAEADVYLAYGRDLQAEEILKDALRTNPGRLAIHQKLLEIFAKRLDTKGFEEVASRVFTMTGGKGTDWEHICEVGLRLDPHNAMYQPGGQPSTAEGTPAALEFTPPPVNHAVLPTVQTHAPLAGGSVDLDLDLDFSLDEEPVTAITAATASNVKIELPELDLDFGSDTVALAPYAVPPGEEAKADEFKFLLPDLDITESTPTRPSASADDFKLQAATSFGSTNPAPLTNSAPKATVAASPPHLPQVPASEAPDFGMLEFDLGSLDLGDAAAPAATPAPITREDPLATKLALAEEFSAIGDDDGARALIEEVISEATGDIKIKAQQALSKL